MIRIFFHRLFWALYDYLGTLTLSGLFAAVGFWLLGFALLSTERLSVVVPIPGMKWILVGMGVAWMVYCVAVFFRVGESIAHERPVHFTAYLLPSPAILKAAAKYAFLVLLGTLLVGSNIYFYALQASRLGKPWGFASFILVLLFVYLMICWLIYLMPLFGTIALEGENSSFLATTRSALISLVVFPSLWVSAFVFFIIISAIGAVSVLGSIFIMPFGSAISCIGIVLAYEFVEKLQQAKSELKESQPLRVYKRRAYELMIEEELRKPLRTWKDIFKPWEY